MRTARVVRQTGETEVDLSLDLDGSGRWEVDTGVGFLDHMLTHLGKHSKTISHQWRFFYGSMRG